MNVLSAITAVTKKYKWIIKKKRQKQDKIVLLAKIKLNTTDFLISKGLSEWDISHDEFSLVNDVLKEYNYMKKALKILIIDEYVW